MDSILDDLMIPSYPKNEVSSACCSKGNTPQSLSVREGGEGVC